jgi:phospholipid/cholesterol/gamma-HCH transport system substrate-binding protein
MGMKSRKVELLVGVFVAVTIAAGLMLALKVASQSMSSSEDSYILYAKFDNIGGLKIRSAVKVGGVTVGRVILHSVIATILQ